MMIITDYLFSTSIIYNIDSQFNLINIWPKLLTLISPKNCSTKIYSYPKTSSSLSKTWWRTRSKLI